MSLKFHYIGPADILNKLERERDRTFHAATQLDKKAMCDHFYNFCITAHALRDWTKKTPNFPIDFDIHEKCNTFTELVACRDIANSNKHFNFAPKAKTKGAVVSGSEENIEISIVIEDEPIRDSNEFMDRVIEIWKSLLQEFSIPFESIKSETNKA